MISCTVNLQNIQKLGKILEKWKICYFVQHIWRNVSYFLKSVSLSSCHQKCFFINVHILIYSRNIHWNMWELIFENFKRKFFSIFLGEFWFLKFRIFISLSSPVWWKSARTSTSLRCKFFSRNAMSIKKIGDVADT